MSDQQKKHKEIAVAFASHFIPSPSTSYDAWLLTEEGKRLTAEETEPKETSYELLVKISEKLDRLEGRCTVTVSELHTRINNRKE